MRLTRKGGIINRFYSARGLTSLLTMTISSELTAPQRAPRSRRDRPKSKELLSRHLERTSGVSYGVSSDSESQRMTCFRKVY